MLDLSPEKILVLGLLALVVLGPDRLPGAARTLGRIIGQLKTMSTGFQSQVQEALHEPADALGVSISDLRPGEIRRSVRDAVASALVPSDPAVGSPAFPPNGAGAYLPPPVGSAALPSPHGGPGWPGWPAVPDDPSLN